MKEIDDAYQVVWLLRRLFRALAQMSDDSLRDLGISAADRAVMEFLHPDKKLSVPEIAERYQVSRQHVQTTVNKLVESGLLIVKVNPRHKRSSLIAPSTKGKALFRTVRARDTKAVRKLFSNITEDDRRVTRETLQALLEKLK